MTRGRRADTRGRRPAGVDRARAGCRRPGPATHREQLHGPQAITARCGEPREEFVEVLQEGFGQRWGIEPPPQAGHRIGSWRGSVRAVRETVSENEPAHDTDAKTAEMTQVLVDLAIPPRGRPGAAPGGRSKSEVPSIVEPRIVHTHLQACDPCTRGARRCGPARASGFLFRHACSLRETCCTSYPLTGAQWRASRAGPRYDQSRAQSHRRSDAASYVGRACS